MDGTQFDRLSKALTTAATRRKTLTGLGALALGGAGLVGLRQNAAADKRQRCHTRCNEHADRNARNHKSRDRCHHRCENRP
jgi:hypothetical protein